MSVTKFIVWEPFFEALKKNGIIDHPDDTRKIVIECEVGRPAMITIFTYADREGLAEAVESLTVTGPDNGKSVVR